MTGVQTCALPISMKELYKEKIRLLEELNEVRHDFDCLIPFDFETQNQYDKGNSELANKMTTLVKQLSSLTERIEKGESEASKEIPADDNPKVIGHFEYDFKNQTEKYVSHLSNEGSKEIPAGAEEYIKDKHIDPDKMIFCEDMIFAFRLEELMEEYASLKVKEAMLSNNLK